MLANRIRHVQLECRDALEVVERFIDTPKALLYIDPPYKAIDACMYKTGADLDHSELEKLIIDAKAKVALSGYPADYPELHEHPKWRRFDMHARMSAAVGGKEGLERVESLWTNYDPRAS